MCPVSTQRWLIVNADDFGLSAGVNRGIAESFERGIVTSASLMVDGAAAEEAARYAHSHPALSVGLHLDLGEWVYDDERWTPAYEIVPLSDASAVRAELARQLSRFGELMSRAPTHIDSHQHVHMFEPVCGIVRRTADRLGVPVRGQDRRIRYCGDFYGQTGRGDPYPDGISISGLLSILARLPAGWNELGCHPGRDGALRSVYRSERALEVATLTDRRIRSGVADGGIRLTSFRALDRVSGTIEQGRMPC